MSRSDHIHPFDLLVARPESEWRLAEAALLFAIDHTPHMRIARYLTRLEGLARRVDRLRARTTEDRAAAIKQVLVDEEQLLGDRERYHDPRNSLLNEVLDRRRGLPIALSAIWMDVGHALGWKMSGIGLPGHFVTVIRAGKSEIILDPFNGGAQLTRAGCEELITHLHGEPVELSDASFTAWPPRAILSRMLGNLLQVLGETDNWRPMLRVLDRLVALNPTDDGLRAKRSAVVRHITLQN